MAQNRRRKTRLDNAEAMNELSRTVKTHEDVISGLRQTIEEIQQSIGESDDSPMASQVQNLSEQLETYETRLTELDGHMQTLQRSTVGTKEYEKAMAQATESMKAMSEIAASLPVAIQRQYEALRTAVAEIVSPLEVMGGLLETVVEMVEGPLSLSDDAIERLSACTEKRLSPSINQTVREVTDQTFRRYEDSFQKMIDDSLSRMAGERERLDSSVSRALGEIDRVDNRLKARTVNVASVVLLVAVVAIGVVVVSGGLWMASSMLGLTVALPTLWERTFSADSFWAGLGWGFGAVGLTAAVVVAVWAAGVYVGKRLDWDVISRR